MTTRSARQTLTGLRAAEYARTLLGGTQARDVARGLWEGRYRILHVERDFLGHLHLSVHGPGAWRELEIDHKTGAILRDWHRRLDRLEASGAEPE